MRRIDIGVGLFFVALGVFAIFAVRNLPVFETNRPGPALFPIMVSIIFIVFGGLLTVLQFVRPSSGEAPEWDRVSRVVGVLALLVIAVILMPIVGFVIVSVLLLGAILFGVERKFTITSVVVVIGLPILFWFAFAELMGLRLPAGFLAP
jgi:putative tricarboxylic transport membrane protein